MGGKLLITPPITPIGLPLEGELQRAGMKGNITAHGPECVERQVQLIDGAPNHFHEACRRLFQSFSGKTEAILVGGTTGEGIGFGPLQYQVLLTAMKKACPPDIRILAGLLGRDDMIQNQIRAAHQLGINEFVLGLNHTGDNRNRYQNTTSMFGGDDKLWLYNMPTFEPASLEFITECAQNLAVMGIKDSSKGSDALRIRYLLEIKERRPDFQVLVGNEAVYPELHDAEFSQIDGLVSGNSNADPELLLQFTQNPKDPDIAGRRQAFHDEIANLSVHQKTTPTETIEAHIHGLKLKLLQLGILEPQHVALYSSCPGRLFQTYP